MLGVDCFLLINCQKHHYAVFKAITKYSKVDKEKVYDLMGIPKNNARYTKKTRKQIRSFVDFRDKLGRMR